MRVNKIAPLWHTCLTSLSACAEGGQLYCPSCTYAAIPYCCFHLSFQFPLHQRNFSNKIHKTLFTHFSTLCGNYDSASSSMYILLEFCTTTTSNRIFILQYKELEQSSVKKTKSFWQNFWLLLHKMHFFSRGVSW